MTELIQWEIQEIFYLFFAAQVVMLMFSLEKKIQERIQRHKRLCKAVYLCFWVLAAIIFYQFAYAGSYGKLSWYGLAVFGFGIMLWNRRFCDIISMKRTVQK